MTQIKPLYLCHVSQGSQGNHRNVIVAGDITVQPTYLGHLEQHDMNINCHISVVFPKEEPKQAQKLLLSHAITV
jgi:hypothetical protein